MHQYRKYKLTFTILYFYNLCFYPIRKFTLLFLKIFYILPWYPLTDVFYVINIFRTLTFYFFQNIEKLPDKVLLNIFSYLSHRQICQIARVCKRWRLIAYDTRLWKCVSLRPEVSGLHVGSLESLLALIR